MRKSLLLLALCTVLASGATFAQFTRLLPDGTRGKTGASQPLPLVTIDSKVFRLAPGGIIYDQHNRSIVHAQLPANADVLYTRNQAGDIQRIYVLTEVEKARRAALGKP